LGEFAFDWLWHQPRWVVMRLARIGFIDDTGEWSICFWRWDFWNSSLRARIEKQEHEEWLRKRAAAIARWGEGAG
jgi:hypothetical protein